MNVSKYVLLGSLQQFLENAENSQAPDEWTNTKRYICVLGIALCMKYLDLKNDIHLNLSPSNIVLDTNFYCHIINSSLSNSSCTAADNVVSFAVISYHIITLKRTAIEIDKIQWPKNKEFFRKCISEDSSNRPSFSEICRYIITKSFIDLFGEIDYNEVNSFLDTFGDDDEASLLKGILNYESNEPTFNDKAKIILKKLSEKGNKEAETFYEKSCQSFGGVYSCPLFVFVRINFKNTITIYIDDSIIIRDLKEFIYERTGYEPDGSIILFNSRKLDDDIKLNIQKGYLFDFIPSLKQLKNEDDSDLS